MKSCPISQELIHIDKFSQSIGGLGRMQSVVSATALLDGRGHLALLRKYLAANLKRLLEERGWDQRTFAEKLGVTESYVSKIIRERGYPPEKRLEQFCEVLGVEPEELTRQPASLASADPIIRFLREQARARGYDLVKKS